jgi:hypothetical protein
LQSGQYNLRHAAFNCQYRRHSCRQPQSYVYTAIATSPLIVEPWTFPPNCLIFSDISSSNHTTLAPKLRTAPAPGPQRRQVAYWKHFTSDQTFTVPLYACPALVRADPTPRAQHPVVIYTTQLQTQSVRYHTRKRRSKPTRTSTRAVRADSERHTVLPPSMPQPPSPPNCMSSSPATTALQSCE